MKKISVSSKIYFYAIAFLAMFLAPIGFTSAQSIQPSLVPTVYTGSAINVTKNTVTLTGSVNSPASGYVSSCPWAWFEYSNNSQMMNASKIGYQAYCISSISADLRDLQPSTTYYYRLVAMNAYGYGTVQGSVLSFKTQDSASGQAPLVYTNAVSSIVNDSVTLSGTVSSNYLDTKAWFEYGNDRSLNFIIGYQSIGNGGTNQNVSAYLQNLNFNTTYYYRVAAQNSNGTSYGETLSFYNQLPSPASQTSGSSVSSNIQVVPNPTQNSYQSVPTANGYFSTGSSVKKSAPKMGPELVFLDPQVDNENPSAGDTINYSVIYKNSGKIAVSNAILKIILPGDIQYKSSNLSASVVGNNLSFDIGTINAQSQGTLNINFKVRSLTRRGTALIFSSVLNYTDSSGNVRSTDSYLAVKIKESASVSASLIDVIGSLLTSWVFDIIIGLALGFGIYNFFIKNPEDDLA